MFQIIHIFLINKFISSAVLQRKSDFRNCQTQFFLATFFLKFLEFFWSYFSSCIFTVIIQVWFQAIHIFLINKFITSAVLQRKSDFRNCQTQFFFSNFFIEIFGIFLVIFFFMHFHSDYSSMFQAIHKFLINKFITSAVLQRKSDFRNCQTQFFQQFFFEIFGIFLSYFSSCIFTVIIQVCFRPIKYFSSISSYQVPFYSEEANSEIVRLSFFNNFFIEIFGIFLVIFFFMYFHSDYSSWFQTNHIFFINKFISSAVLQRKSDFRNCQTQFFLTTFFLKFLEYF